MWASTANISDVIADLNHHVDDVILSLNNVDDVIMDRTTPKQQIPSAREAYTQYIDSLQNALDQNDDSTASDYVITSINTSSRYHDDEKQLQICRQCSKPQLQDPKSHNPAPLRCHSFSGSYELPVQRCHGDAVTFPRKKRNCSVPSVMPPVQTSTPKKASAAAARPKPGGMSRERSMLHDMYYSIASITDDDIDDVTSMRDVTSPSGKHGKRSPEYFAVISSDSEADSLNGGGYDVIHGGGSCVTSLMHDDGDYFADGYCACRFCRGGDDVVVVGGDDMVTSSASTKDQVVPTSSVMTSRVDDVFDLFCRCSVTAELPHPSSSVSAVVESSGRQEALQEDIERHTNGITSVLNLCEVLLHDTDACPTVEDQKSLEDASKSLDRRWKNICNNSNLRRNKIEETQDEWKKFISDYSKFKDWLEVCEKRATQPNTQQVSHKNAKVELNNYQSFQRDVHQQLTLLELINKQYRKLTRENKTDTSEKLKKMIQDGNERWDLLMKRIYSVIRRLKHAIARKENYNVKHNKLTVWLIEQNLQVTKLMHLTKMSDAEKLYDFKIFKDGFLERLDAIRDLDRTAAALVQSCEPGDAMDIEAEMRDFHKLCCDVIASLSKYNEKLFRSTGVTPNCDVDDEMRGFQWWRPPAANLLRPPHHPSATATTSGSGGSSRFTPSSGAASLEWDMYGPPPPTNKSSSPHRRRSRTSSPHRSRDVTDDDDTIQLHDDFLSPASRGGSPSRRSSSRQTNRDDFSKRSSPISMTQLHSDTSPFLNSNKRRRASMTSRSRSPSPHKSGDQLRDDVTSVLRWLDSCARRATGFDDVIDYRSVSIAAMTSHAHGLHELEREMEARRPLVKSINLLMTSQGSEEAEMNARWREAGIMLAMKREKLQQILVESIDFKENVEDLDAFVDDLRHQLYTSSSSWSDPSQPQSVSTLRKTRKELSKLRVQILEKNFNASETSKICNEIVRGSDVTGAATSSKLRSAAHGSAVDLSRRLGSVSDRLKTLLGMVDGDLHKLGLRLQEERKHARRGSDISATTSEADSLTSMTSSDVTPLHASPLKTQLVRRKEHQQELTTTQAPPRELSTTVVVTSQRSAATNATDPPPTTSIKATTVEGKVALYRPRAEVAATAAPTSRSSFISRSILAAVPFWFMAFVVYITATVFEPEDSHVTCMRANTYRGAWGGLHLQWGAAHGPPPQ